MIYGAGSDLRDGGRRGSGRSLLRELCCGKDTMWGGSGHGQHRGAPPRPPQGKDGSSTSGSSCPPRSTSHGHPAARYDDGGALLTPRRDPSVSLAVRRGVRGAGGPQPEPGGAGGAAAGAVPSPGLLRSARGQQKVGHVCLGRHRNSSGGFKTRADGAGGPHDTPTVRGAPVGSPS